MRPCNKIKIINSILPFNEYFYRDCFYNSLFSVINYLEGDICDILANEIQIYNHIPSHVLTVGITTIESEPMETILRRMNILYNRSEKGTDQKEICDALDQDKPVIIMVDCFEESIRAEYYKKKHFDHNLLVYGYHLEHKEFYIIEHSGKNRLDYKKRVIPIETVLKASDAYILQYQSNKQDSSILYKFYHRQSWRSDREDAKVAFCKNYLMHEEIIRNQSKELDMLKCILSDIIADRKKLSTCIESIVKAITVIINAKVMEKRKYELFLNHIELKRLMQSIINGWTIIRLNLMNYQYGGIMIDRKLDDVVSRLNEIVFEEKRLIQAVFCCCHQSLGNCIRP
ncbi:BtrH N-terminal domain-containing protein [Enterocloster clostridioformis]